MNLPVQSKILFLAPVGTDIGLSSMALGLVRALERDGIRVGFAKPISQASKSLGTPDLSVHFAQTLCGIDVPPAISFDEAEQLLRAGRGEELMEEVVQRVAAVRAQFDVVIVEGLLTTSEQTIAPQLNIELARSLTADLVLVASAARRTARELVEGIELAQRPYLDAGLSAAAAVIVNKLPAGAEGQPLAEDLLRSRGTLPVIACVPFEASLNAPRLLDVAAPLDLRIEHLGNANRLRVHEIVVAARSVEKMADRLRPGALVVTPGDRSDVVLATALATLRGVPLAGLLLTCGEGISPCIVPLVQPAKLAGLPVLTTHLDTFETSALLARLPSYVSREDAERMEQVIEFAAERIDTSALKQKIGEPRELRMPPPAFRHLLIGQARAAGKRIVLPEGDEPRTLKAAVICQQKGIARCVLLGKPERIREVADAQGLTLPSGIEIIDPEQALHRYVAPMVELRKAKGLTAPQAEKLLEDTVVMGTMMLALGEVDGLVSGAVHTTANTVRPALQLIKTAPGASIVSSVFFMLMPDQVLVYGDCAINPDPSAEQLADIAIQSADSALAFGLEPRVAMISYSTGASGSGDDVEKVRAATRIAREKRPGLLIDGPMQYDAASVESVGRQKAPDSPVAGRANVFVFPDLNTGNTTYKAVQRSAGVVSVGPMLQGLRKPVNDLSRGALVDDIVYTIALTAIQAAQ
ncbi:phosphate acetyltransferase [Crenobacter caeni]|uniref:Phosphate acetyltransferase n=1 Tax=Crenobacter caeni TaxID=2705474 RepID=A0A6B2KTQ1_9NEIS|nr:phosphate acetyltransferase [Crenobacter caeni]NDV13511.1 phosphate acetyltransferase [Crenobacter caeni]